MISSKIPFNVFAFGSPVIDITNKVDIDFLNRHNIKKGEALLTHEHHNAFIEELSNMAGSKFTLGGSAMNTLRAFTWGIKAHQDQIVSKMCSGCATDDFAKKLKEGLTQQKIQYLFEEKANEHSPRCGCATFEKDRSMVCFIGNVQKYSEEFFESHFSEISDFDCLILEGYYLSCDPEKTQRLLDFAEKNKKYVASSISSEFIAYHFLEPLKTLIRESNIVFCNKKESLAWAESAKLDCNHDDPLEVGIATCRNFKKTGFPSKYFVVTHDEKPVGVVKYNQDTDEVVSAKMYDLPIVLQKDEVEDMNGAGDTFMGVFIAGRILGKDVEECVKVGNYASSLVIQRIGCDFPVEINLYN